MTHLDAPRPRFTPDQLRELACAYRAAAEAFFRGGDPASGRRAERHAKHYQDRLDRMAGERVRASLVRAR